MTLSMPVGEDTTTNSPEPPCPPTPSRSSRAFSPCSIPPPTPTTVDRARILEETHNQVRHHLVYKKFCFLTDGFLTLGSALLVQKTISK